MLSVFLACDDPYGTAGLRIAGLRRGHRQLPVPHRGRLMSAAPADNTVAFSGVSGAVEYTFPLLLSTRVGHERFSLKVERRV
jgi:hypothetical protein